MVPLNNGNALAFAGCAGGCSGPNILGQFIFPVGSSAEIYDFQANSWSQAGSLNTTRGGMANGNLNQTAITLADGRVLACNGNDGFSTSFDSCEIYDPVTNQWSVTGSIGETGTHPLAVLPNGKVLAIMNDGLTARLFDPSAGTWSAAGPLMSQQSHGILTALKTGEILLSGGSDGTGPVSTAQIYHPATDSWSAATAMSAARSGHIASLLDDGRVLVAGGLSTNSVILNSAEIFDPGSATWSATGSMLQPRMGASAIRTTH
jgi:N-acetylneuraminic acid mutarotase